VRSVAVDCLCLSGLRARVNLCLDVVYVLPRKKPCSPLLCSRTARRVFWYLLSCAFGLSLVRVLQSLEGFSMVWVVLSAVSHPFSFCCEERMHTSLVYVVLCCEVILCFSGEQPVLLVLRAVLVSQLGLYGVRFPKGSVSRGKHPPASAVHSKVKNPGLVYPGWVQAIWQSSCAFVQSLPASKAADFVLSLLICLPSHQEANNGQAQRAPGGWDERIVTVGSDACETS